MVSCTTTICVFTNQSNSSGCSSVNVIVISNCRVGTTEAQRVTQELSKLQEQNNQVHSLDIQYCRLASNYKVVMAYSVSYFLLWQYDQHTVST